MTSSIVNSCSDLFGILMQLEMPRLISEANTTELRNIFDADFDETIAEFKSFRLETRGDAHALSSCVTFISLM